MSAISADLEQFLEVVGKVSSSVAETPGCLADAWSSVEGAGLPSLARDSADEADAMLWLTHTVRVAAESSPPLAYVLAARYTADLVLDEGSGRMPSFALTSQHSTAVVSTSPEPDVVLVTDVDQLKSVVVRWEDVSEAAAIEPRTGLADARPASLPLGASATSSAVDATSVLSAWDVLAGAALVGIAERAVRVSNAYVLERRQFGVPIGSFAGLRALVAQMRLRADSVRAVLDRALDGAGPSESVGALAGTTAIANCVDAIQALGGYGYMVEYPVADLLRDAVSLQARAGGRRLHVARISLRELGPPVESPS